MYNNQRYCSESINEIKIYTKSIFITPEIIHHFISNNLHISTDMKKQNSNKLLIQEGVIRHAEQPVSNRFNIHQSRSNLSKYTFRLLRKP